MSSTEKSFSFDLSGRTVLITGASSGIGRRFALLLADSGANVVIAARRLTLLQELKSEIEARGRRALAVAMDVADEQSTIEAYNAAEAEFGSVDSVIANAGINIGGSALGLKIEDFDQVTSVNLRGVFLTAREGARRMVAAGSEARGHGRIVLISSITAHHQFSGVVAYSASKAGMNQLGRIFAKDWARKGINVNAVCPGYMRTELNDAYWETEAGRKLISEFPRKRLMDPAALDALLLFLCSDASAHVTGSVFTIDDGQTL